MNWKNILMRVGIVHRPKISLLIPFSSDDPKRERNFKWLIKYWRHQLPDAEIVIGHSKSKVFCKGEALNNAFKKSSGKVLAVVDADAYLRSEVIEYCADRILEEQARGHNLWFVPYRFLYRLTERVTEHIVHSNPAHPYIPLEPPLDCQIECNHEMVRYGSMYGAMITIFPRKAMEVIKCFDEHFYGWGGEDMAFLLALDTMFGKHKTTGNAVFHLWHHYHGKTHRERTWDNQDKPNANNWKRTNRYHFARRNPSKMRELVEENYGFYNMRVDEEKTL